MSNAIVASFRNSTHCTKWIFPDLPLLSNTTLNEQQKLEVELRENPDPEKERQTCPPRALNYAQLETLLQKHNIKKKFDEKALLTWTEEMILINDSIQKMIYLIEQFKSFTFPQRVKATATLYFRRFFHKNSVMEWSITNILVACIFVASKTEEFHLSLEVLLETLKEATSKAFDPDVVLSSELVLLNGLDFDLRIIHPYRILIANIHTIWTGDLRETLQIKCSNLLDEVLYKTNAALIFLPGIIAFGVLHAVLCGMENSSTHINTLNEYIRNSYGEKSSEILKQIERMSNCALDLPQDAPPAVLKQITRKLRPILKVVDSCKELELQESERSQKLEAQKKEELKLKQAQEEEEKMHAFLMSKGTSNGGLFS